MSHDSVFEASPAAGIAPPRASAPPLVYPVQGTPPASVFCGRFEVKLNL